MKQRVLCFIYLFITVGFVWLLNVQLPLGGGHTPRLGYFLSPSQGFWQNAEPVNKNYNETITLKGLQQPVTIYFDDRLVPHVYAKNEADAAYVQGYLHAKFRLWQMDFETRIAGGRLSEILGKDKLFIDKYFRRMGMVYAAEKAEKAIVAQPETKAISDAYTAGVNAYIHQLTPNEIPFEFKLLNYKPENWTNLKSALFLKLMSYDLAYGSNDIAYTNARNFFGYDKYMQLFPNWQDTMSPIIPRGTSFTKPSIKPTITTENIHRYLQNNTSTLNNQPAHQPNPNNGSNNWAVSGSKTKSGKPILCNDPHLGLNLPSLWYEMQICTPAYNTYGVSFPGAPTIVIGFNDSIAWGVTNAGRDVKDFYQMKFKDSTMQQYWYNGKWQTATIRKEIIKIKNAANDTEKIAMTIYGPVMYDAQYKAADSTGATYALRWTAHDSSNELLTFYKLNQAHNYNDYKIAISTFQCPGQNFIFASKSGDIAICQQGKFPARWAQQGDFVLTGIDSTYNWQGFIPNDENPQMKNPTRGFVSSANQKATDSTYPYYLGRAANFDIYRGFIINRYLSQMSNITPQVMMKMQTDNYNLFAEAYQPIFTNNINEELLNKNEKKYFDAFKNWKLRSDPNEVGATIFELWKDSFETVVLGDDYADTTLPKPYPPESSLVENIIRNPHYPFLDNIITKDTIETLADDVLLAFKKIIPALDSLSKAGKLPWAKYKDTHIEHLTKLDALSRLHLPIGGGKYMINAALPDHGPSWRMIVELSSPIVAYGVYPGGQSGNPGSPYYDNFIDTWAAGKYYPLLILTEAEAQKNTRVKWKMICTP